MATQTRIKLDRQAIGTLAKSAGVRDEMLRRARLVAASADEAASRLDPSSEVIASGYIGRNRARASVMWVGGLRYEHKHRILGQAIDAARG